MSWVILVEKVLSSLFIISMSMLLLFWCLPEGYVFRELLHRTLGNYICWAGLDNYWALFSPQPVSKNFLLSFEIELENGKIIPWKLPEYEIFDGYQQTSHFRFIKMHNQLLSQKDPIPKEAICKYIYQTFREQDGNGNIPTHIHIIRYYEPVASMLEIPWLSQRVFTYQVDC